MGKEPQQDAEPEGGRANAVCQEEALTGDEGGGILHGVSEVEVAEQGTGKVSAAASEQKYTEGT